MSTTAQWLQSAHKTNGNGSVSEPREATTFIDARQYLDFKYGANSVDITLPNQMTVKLVVGTDGRAYFEMPA